MEKAEPAGPKEIEKPLCLKTEVSWLRLGELDVACIPGEIYPELVLGKVQDPVDPGADFPDAPVEPSIYGQLSGKYKMLIGLGNDEIGYILPKRQWDEPSFLAELETRCGTSERAVAQRLIDWCRPPRFSRLFFGTGASDVHRLGCRWDELPDNGRRQGAATTKPGSRRR